MDTQELKNLSQQVSEAVESFNSTAEVIKELKAQGKGFAEAEKKLDEANNEITRLQEKQDKLEAALSHNNFDSKDVEEKGKELQSKIFKDFFHSKESNSISLDEFAAKSMNDLGIEAKDLSVNIPEDGGYGVFNDFGGLVMGRTFETSPMRQYATVTNTGSDRMTFIVDDDEAASGWVGEIEARPSTSTPQIKEVEIPVHEIYAKPRATQKMIDDFAFGAESWLTGKITDKFSRAENAAFVTGNSTKQPKGFTTYAQNTSDPDGYVFNQLGTIETSANNVIEAQDIIRLYENVKAEYLGNSAYFMSRQTEGYIRRIVTLATGVNADNFVWQPGLEQGAPNTLNGYPVARFEDMADADGTSGTAGNVAIAFGDMRRSYTIVDRLGVRILRDPYSAKPYVEFYSTKRVGGGLVSFDALKLLKIKSA